MSGRRQIWDRAVPMMPLDLRIQLCWFGSAISVGSDSATHTAGRRAPGASSFFLDARCRFIFAGATDQRLMLLFCCMTTNLITSLP